MPRTIKANGRKSKGKNLIAELKSAEEEIKTAATQLVDKIKNADPTNSVPLTQLVDEINGVKTANSVDEIKTADPESDLDAKRRKLTKSCEDGEIDQSVKYLQKASAKDLEKIHKKMKDKRLEKANAFITDMLLSRFADTLDGLDAIASSEELNNDLQKDKLLKRDIENIVAYATPFLPFLGLISGELTTGKHVFTHCNVVNGVNGVNSTTLDGTALP